MLQLGDHTPMFESLQSTQVWSVQNSDTRAIATIDAGRAYYTDVQLLLKRIAKTLQPEQASSAQKEEKEDGKKDNDEEPRLGPSPLTLLEFVSTMLLFRLTLAVGFYPSVAPEVGRMHFDYSKVSNEHIRLLSLLEHKVSIQLNAYVR